MKFVVAAGMTTLYLAVLVAIHVAHARLLPVNVVFYASIADVVIAAGVAGAFLAVSSIACRLGGFERLLLMGIWLLVGYSLAISVPTVIDRSLSFYILEKLEQRGGAIRLDKFEEVFTKEYVREHRLVDVRLTEQAESGTIVIVDGCVRLTAKGSAIASFSRFYRRHFLPKLRLLMEKYTDDRADPFPTSALAPNDAC